MRIGRLLVREPQACQVKIADRAVGFLLPIIATLLLAACEPVTLEDLRQADDYEQFNRLAWRLSRQGEEAIPTLLIVMEQSLETKYSLLSYGKLNTCLVILHELATDGVYTLESVPVLVHVIEEQIVISDTLITAEILTIITGIDPGWDEEFVESYTLEDYPQVLEKIEQWREWQPPQ